ncbi:MAG: hypothetical protein JXR89_07390, partial [Deltaproteobacteria bacterium]|nr:hypothetical protein [Deltaproteobacteria bacterium]
ERRRIEQEIKEEVEQQLAADLSFKSAAAIIVASPDWHPGVLGIVSARIAEQHNKPTILLKLEHGLARGSGRSIAGFNLIKALEECRGLLERYGGHEQAAGLTIKEQGLGELRQHFEETLSRHPAAGASPPPLHLDAVLNPGDINPGLLAEIKRLEPFGEGNPEPIFALLGARQAKAAVSSSNGRRHARFVFTGADQESIPAIAFDFNSPCPDNGSLVDLVFCPEENNWRGQTEIRLKLLKLFPHEPQP